MREVVVGKGKKLATLAKVSLRHPSSIGHALTYLGKFGFVGLRERLYQEWLLEDEYTPLVHGIPGSAKGRVKLSILVPVASYSAPLLDKTLASIARQTYNNWEVCVAGNADVEVCGEAAVKTLQNACFTLSAQEGTAAALNAAAAASTGSYCLILYAGDELSQDALYEVALSVSNTRASVIYYDHEEIDEQGSRLSSLFKPDFSPDLLLSQMYLGRSFVFERSVFEKTGGFQSAYEGSEDYDFVLRALEQDVVVEHLALPLCLQRDFQVLGGISTKAQAAGQRALQDHLDRVYGSGYAQVYASRYDLVYDIRYTLKDEVRVSLIIPTKDHVQDLRALIESLTSKTDYTNYEIIILDNNSSEPETFVYFDELAAGPLSVQVIAAHYQFNWSKLNNQGAAQAAGEVLVFLNNDVEVISPEWLTRLVENCLRDEIGVVGGLLLYPDRTIQHAGVVIGMGGWADHVYKGDVPTHHGGPFISPLVAREVSAVTGACMAISREIYNLVGGFNEDFIVCGSDVELCLRTRDYGLRNLYLPCVNLFHFESKSRDPRDIPEIDFELSQLAYRRYLEAGDPYYNKNLDYSVCIPTGLSRRQRLRKISRSCSAADIAEVTPLRFRFEPHPRTRINLLIPSINQEDIYGGIATALSFFNRLVDALGADGRLIITDGEPRLSQVREHFSEYELLGMDESSFAPRQIVPAVDRLHGDIATSEQDWFMCTTWWSAYCMQQACAHPTKHPLSLTHPLIYLVQDFEPGFYPWSTRYLLAESTYKSDVDTLAVFNSFELRQYFEANGYAFTKAYHFNPYLHDTLRTALARLDGTVAKRRQILVYGRPSVDRNAFELVVDTLRHWIDIQKDYTLWELVSAGEKHAPIYLKEGRYLCSTGKLSINEYAKLLAESYAGLSFMVSPHPSYPPLEMAAFGVAVITNSYGSKDLSQFSPAITSLDCATPAHAAAELKRLCDQYHETCSCAQVQSGYLTKDDSFGFVGDLKALIERSGESAETEKHSKKDHGKGKN